MYADQQIDAENPSGFVIVFWLFYLQTKSEDAKKSKKEENGEEEEDVEDEEDVEGEEEDEEEELPEGEEELDEGEGGKLLQNVTCY